MGNMQSTTGFPSNLLWDMVNLFSLGCHVIDRAYASIDCTGGGRGDYQKDGRYDSKVPWQIHIFYIGHLQYGQLTAVKTG